MEHSFGSAQTNLLRRKSKAEDKVFRLEGDKLTYQERIEGLMEKAGDIVKNALMVNKAEQLLENELKGMTGEEIRNIPEEKMGMFSDPYENAVIVAICLELIKRRKGMN